MNMEVERIKESMAQQKFVGETLFKAVDRLALRRGEILEDINRPGYTIKVSTGAEDDSMEDRITFEATYGTVDGHNFGFIYELVKSEYIAEDFKQLSEFNKQKTIELLESDEAECADEQAEGLLALIEVYLDENNKKIDELPYVSEYRISCMANQVGDILLIERSLLTYVDSILISQISIGNLAADDASYDDEENAETDTLDNPDDDGDYDEYEQAGELDEREQRELDLSTPTIEDLAELREMLCMLGLADRKRPPRGYIT